MSPKGCYHEFCHEQESARKQRLRDLASDMHAILNEHPAAGEVKDEASSCSARLEDVSYEDDDDQTLCIVCMTHKRNACLVHGKTSHQVTINIYSMFFFTKANVHLKLGVDE